MDEKINLDLANRLFRLANSTAGMVNKRIIVASIEIGQIDAQLLVHLSSSVVRQPE
jgi:methionyl-tRNA synthetase